MGLFDQLAGKKYTTLHYATEDGAGEEILALDACISETHTSTSEATEHPIEDGSFIADHMIFKGYSLNITAIVSDNPFSLLGTVLGNAAGVVGSVVPGGALGGAVATGLIAGVGGSLTGGGKGKPSRNAYDALTSVQELGIPLFVITGLRGYNNMALGNLTINRDSATGKALSFTASLKQIRVARSELVEVPLKSLSADAQGGSKKKSFGAKAKKGATPAVSSKGSSILFKLAG